MPDVAPRTAASQLSWRDTVTDVVAEQVIAALAGVRRDVEPRIPDPTTLQSLAEVIAAMGRASAAVEARARESLSPALFELYADLGHLERVLWSAQSTRHIRTLDAAVEALRTCSDSESVGELLDAGDRGIASLALETPVNAESGAWQVLAAPTPAPRQSREQHPPTQDAFDRALVDLYRESFGYAVDRALLLDRFEALREELAEDPFGAGPGLGVLTSPTVAPPAPSAPVDREEANLSRREREVLDLLGEGCSSATIARRLVISESTVKTHVKGILRKLGASNRTEAVARWHQLSER